MKQRRVPARSATSPAARDPQRLLRATSASAARHLPDAAPSTGLAPHQTGRRTYILDVQLK